VISTASNFVLLSLKKKEVEELRMTSRRELKCVIIGDSNVGKTSMLSRFCRNVFPMDHTPTIFDDDTGKNFLL
jgi:GTPase SAR1 family protein